MLWEAGRPITVGGRPIDPNSAFQLQGHVTDVQVEHVIELLNDCIQVEHVIELLYTMYSIHVFMYRYSPDLSLKRKLLDSQAAKIM